MKQKTQQKSLKKKKKSKIFRFYEKVVSKIYGKKKIVGIENIPKEACVIIGNHAQIHGPLFSAVQFPYKKYVWCIGNMMHLKEVPSYAFTDFWSKKPKWTHWFWKIIAHLIAPLAVYIFNRADVIGVYKDTRGLSTFRNSVDGLKDGAHIIIFPECETAFNEIVYEFQDKFVDLARLYFKDTGKELSFVPMYNAPKLKTVVFGKPIKFDSSDKIENQRKTVCDYLKNEITKLAKELPEHIVVPYLNLPKKQYPKSK